MKRVATRSSFVQENVEPSQLKQNPGESMAAKTEESRRNPGETMPAKTEESLLYELRKLHKGNSETQKQLHDLRTSFDANTASNQKVCDELTQTIKNVAATVEENGKETRDTIKRIAIIESNFQKQQSYIMKLESRILQLEEEKRKANLILSGYTESKDENLSEVIVELLHDLKVSFDSNEVEFVFRLGTKRDRGGPRPILVKLRAPRLKIEVYKHVNNLKGIQKWNRVYLGDDVPPEIQGQRRDLRSIVALARSEGHMCKLRGGDLVMDNVKYTYRDIDRLPHGLSLEKAKVVTVDDGLAFQGHHAFMSSMFPCKILFESHVYSNAEQLFQTMCAVEANDRELASEIRSENDPYVIRRMAKKIRITKVNEDRKVEIMRKVIRLKFDQNDNLRDKLLATVGNLYEATMDRLFGCGLTLSQKKDIKSENVKSGNKLGLLLQQYREDILN